MWPVREDLLRLAPVFVSCGFGILIMLLDPFVRRERKGILARVALVGVLASLGSVYWMAQHHGAAFSSLLTVDTFSVFLHVVIFAVAALVILASYDYLERENLQMGEFYALVLFASAGMAVMAGANELVTGFLGLEASSIASYVLAGFRRNVLKSNESAMKYFLLGSFATAFFLYGAAMLYGGAGTTRIDLLAQRISQSGAGGLITMGMGMIFVGLAFKVAAAPFQLWTPDAYEGAPTPVTALLSSGPKAAAFALMLRVFFTAFGGVSDLWFWVIWVTAALTMFAGNLAALVQTNVKRMLAYSSIAHAGYILVAFAARSDIGVAAVLFYLVAYALMKVGAFSIVAHLGDTGERRVALDDFAGLGVRQPVTAAALALFLLSLLGLPVTAGFLGKLYIFQAALNAASDPDLRRAMVWLVVLMAVNSIIGAYYYLRLIVVMYFHEPAADWSPQPLPMALVVVVLVTALGTIYLGIFPGIVGGAAAEGAMSLVR